MSGNATEHFGRTRALQLDIHLRMPPDPASEASRNRITIASQARLRS
jgi:hypothetical protein